MLTKLIVFSLFCQTVMAQEHIYTPEEVEARKIIEENKKELGPQMNIEASSFDTITLRYNAGVCALQKLHRYFSAKPIEPGSSAVYYGNVAVFRSNRSQVHIFLRKLASVAQKLKKDMRAEGRETISCRNEEVKPLTECYIGNTGLMPEIEASCPDDGFYNDVIESLMGF